MKNLIKATKKFIIPGAFLVSLLFVASFTYALAPIGDGGGLPTIHYTVSTSEINGAYGTISPGYISNIAPNTSVSFSIIPSSGYGATASGCSGSLSGTTYTTGAINYNCTVTATYALLPPVVVSFYPTNTKVNVGGYPHLNWSVTGANHCWITGPNNYESANFTSNNKQSLTVPTAISTPTTYYLNCTTTAIGTTAPPPTVNVCQGTVIGSIGADGSVPGPYEGYDCAVFKTQSTCLQGWPTHGCSWTSF